MTEGRLGLLVGQRGDWWKLALSRAPTSPRADAAEGVRDKPIEVDRNDCDGDSLANQDEWVLREEGAEQRGHGARNGTLAVPSLPPSVDPILSPRRSDQSSDATCSVT